MRIALVIIGNSRRSNYLNGETLRYGSGGGSGTDSSAILVAEYLASVGHEVVMATEELEPKLEEEYKNMGRKLPYGTKVRGVNYTNLRFDGIENKTFDVLISTLWFQDYNSLPIKTTKSLIYWCHMQWVYGIAEIINYAKDNNLSLGFVDISKWAQSMNKDCVNSAVAGYSRTKTTLIPNAILDDVIEEVCSQNLIKKPHKFIFHAAWARGGNVSLEAVRRLNFPDSEFHAFDYLMATHAHTDTFFHMHNGVDKKTLFSHLAESSYFIYPLYTPYKNIHIDTFSCVVAEAIAFGCKVITYPLGALPENFYDYCYWLENPPNSLSFEEINKNQLTPDVEETFNYTDNIVKLVQDVESGSVVKDISNGKNYILNNFGTNKIGKLWQNFIEELLNI